LLFFLASSLAFAHEGHDHSTNAPDPASRTWTFTDTGAHLHGTYISALNGKVSIRKSDGSIVSLAIDQLTKTDQKWIDNRMLEIRRINEQRDSRVFLVQSRTAKSAPPIAASFEPFAKLKQVRYRQDDNFFYVESNSMPDHQMMVGITAWQQQVPIPQPYFGDNAWRIPLHPVVAKNPMSAKSHFFRGAIALAANGIPIFNPIKNDGRTDTLIAGELDIFGGHCGRADDYHYHIAPTHLQDLVGKENPVAYALDGYAIYGYTEPDGSTVTGLDEFNGHTTPGLGYHYHATKTYPYLNGGFHGEVAEVDGQVDPQPRTGGVREALPPWRGAKITGFESKNNKSFSVKVEVGRETHYVNYVLNDNGSVKFDFVDNNGKVTTETYSPRQQGRGGPGGGKGGPGGGKGGPGGGKGGPGGGKGGPGGGKGGPGGGKGGPGGGKGGPGGQGGKGGSGGDRPPRDGKAPPSGGPGPDRPPRDRQGPGGPPRPENRPNEARRGETNTPATTPMIITAKKSGNFQLTSPVLVEGQPLPDEFNGNGEGATPPLEWIGAPAGTKSFALVMDHIDRDNFLKTYWNLYGIPANVTSLPKNVQGVGRIGATWKRDQAYVPPHSAGGAKQTYTLHLYALSIVPQFDEKAGPVTREALLTKIKDHILDSSDLNVTYQRPDGEASGGKGGPGGQGGKGGPGSGKSGKGRPEGQGGQGRPRGSGAENRGESK
jgi:phosphatidylethanolamine-binding protein (PEBP) family uncharacterized protein